MKTNTYREILQQPDVWQKEYQLVNDSKVQIESFISKYISEGYEIILSGAGTSAFIEVLTRMPCALRSPKQTRHIGRPNGNKCKITT